jgi:hypothetical protein
MVNRIKEIVAEYEERLRGKQNEPEFSHGRRMLCADGGPNRIFLTCLFSDMALAIPFMKDVSLIRSKVRCNTCDRDMMWSADPICTVGFRSRCRKRIHGVTCRATASIKHGSWTHLRYQVRYETSNNTDFG